MVMDEMSGKRTVDKLHPTKRSGLVMRDTSSFSARDPQPCNRLGCSGRLNILKSGQGVVAGSPPKAKSARSSVFLSGGKEGTGSSSKNGNSPLSATEKPKKEAVKKIALKLGTKSSESSSIKDGVKAPETVPLTEKIQKRVEESSTNGGTVMEVGSSSSGPASISGSRNCSNSKNLGSSKAKSARQQPSIPNMAQCGLRTPKCNPTGDAVSSGGSLLQHNSLSKRKDLFKSRTSEVETSSSRGKRTDDALPSTRNGISISESRRTRNSSPPEAQRSAGPVRVRGSPVSPTERNTRSSSTNDSRFTFPRLSRPAVDGNSSSSNSSCESSSESLLRRFTRNRLGSGGGVTPRAGSSSPESLDIASHSIVDWESFQNNPMDGIAEVLSVLGRIERDGLNYEQLISLETNLFLSTLGIYDQHRDMRMDIDNMSYEELLALEERMGTVSTALSEEALTKCVKIGSYQKTKCAEDGATSTGKDETKCSICQEEYVDEDEVGRLQCEHTYHVDCINQWLRLKNWCPICKGSAESSPSSPQP